MKHITFIHALRTAAKIHDSGVTWSDSLEQALTLRELFNYGFSQGFTQEEMIKLFFSNDSHMEDQSI